MANPEGPSGIDLKIRTVQNEEERNDLPEDFQLNQAVFAASLARV